VVQNHPMAARCAFKDGGRRCSRNGFGPPGAPALCRAHAIQANLDGKQVEFSEESPVFDLLELADRAFSRSNNDFAKQMGNIFGDFLAGRAHQSQQAQDHQDLPPQPPPEPPRPEKDPWEVLGFEPGQQLTAAIVKGRQRDLAMIFHPDKQGGSTEAMKRVNDAASELLKTL
jgi:hypothetical protein